MTNLIIFYSIVCFLVQIGYCMGNIKQGYAMPIFNLIFAPIITPVMIGAHYSKP